MSTRKIAFFDFCDTIVKTQTADRFVKFCLDNHPTQYGKCLGQIYRFLKITGAVTLLEKLLPGLSVNKRLLLLQIRGLKETVITELAVQYVKSELQPLVNSLILQRMLDMMQEGCFVVIVSGGYDVYLREFAKIYRVPCVIATKIGFTSGVCDGVIRGSDCMADHKVNMIIERLGSEAISEGESFAFSDNESDLPLLRSVKNGYVVSRGVGQNWVKSNNLKEIIWL